MMRRLLVRLVVISSALWLAWGGGMAEQPLEASPHRQDTATARLVLVHGAVDEGDVVTRCAALNPDGTDYQVLVRDINLYDEFHPACNYRNIAALAPDGGGWLQVFRYPNDLDTYGDDDYELEVSDENGENPITLVSRGPELSGGRTFHWRATWLPDSRVLFWDQDFTDEDRGPDFSGYLDTGELHLFSTDPVTDTLVAAFTEGIHRPLVTLTPDGLPALAVSPDGEYVLFQSGEPGQMRLEVVHLDGSGVEALVDSGQVGHCVNWSPDARQIAFPLRQDDTTTVEVINVDGSGRRALAEGRYPVWSPDGQQIAFSCPGEDQTYHLCLIAPDGSGYRQLAMDYPGDVLSPYWSPDGQQIAFIGQRPRTGDEFPNADPYDLVIYDLEAGQAFTLLSHESAWVWDCGNYDSAIKWSPDGAWLLYRYEEPMGHAGRTEAGDSFYFVCNRDGCRELHELVEGMNGDVAVFHVRWMPVR